MAQILDGKGFAKKIQANLKEKIAQLEPQMGRPPGLAVLMVGDNPASAAYVRNKERSCKRVGIASFGKHFAADVTQAALDCAQFIVGENTCTAQHGGVSD